MSLIAQFAQTIQPILNIPFIRRMRRNHGLEHATIHLLNSQRYRLSGRSSDAGFVLIGDVPTEKVEKAAHEALRRMKGGQHGMAVHPNCGTNLATTGLLTSLVGLIGFAGQSRRDILNRFSMVMVMMMMAVLFSQPLGESLQRHITTSGEPGDLEIESVTRKVVKLPFGDKPVTMHNVVTRGG